MLQKVIIMWSLVHRQKDFSNKLLIHRCIIKVRFTKYDTKLDYNKKKIRLNLHDKF